MKVPLHELVLKVDVPFVTEVAQNYRPPSWPPPPEWPVVVDKAGRVVSRWGEQVWDLTPWCGSPVRLVFGDAGAGPGSVIADNAELMRQSIGWLIWGPRGYRSVGTIKNKFSALWTVFSLCNRNGIRASSLQRFPKVLEQLPACIASSRWETTIAVLHRLYDARGALSFTILDESGLNRLAEAASGHENVQTPYIPPRIWVYQVTRLRECLDEFIAHRAQIESCFNYCLDAYVTNYKTLEAALGKKNTSRGPFTKGNDPLRERHYIGPFAETARRFGIEDLMRRWVVGWDETRVSMFSSYLSLVAFAGQVYIANFTLQRREEVNALRADCLIWENDEKLGRIPLIRGETTKTETDADARWVASPSIEIAVDALASIARLRMGCDVSNSVVRPSPADVTNPYLSSTPTEPWGFGIGKVKPYDIRRKLPNIKNTLHRYPQLFDEAELRITSEDLKVARRITPNLPEDEFAVGRVWPLAWHQYRRTAAVNMTASGVISNSSMQQQMKQATRIMPLYYGRGHTDLRLNDEVEQVIVTAMYEAMAFRLQEVVSDRFISPHSAERKDAIGVNLLAAKDVKSLAAWARQGKVSFREHRLGGCMKPGPCDYGGIESVARCGGGDGNAPCTDVVFDREREEQVRNQLRHVTGKMEQLSSEHPRYSALAAECKAMENYLNVVAANR